MTVDKIYLVGFMGAGKSTVARALGRRLGWKVHDIDERIEALERRSIPAIFSQSGEPYFREVERAMLHSLIPAHDIIVSTGGGTCADPDNRAAMLATGAVVWLDLPFDRVVARVPADGRRPLAQDRALLEQLYESRLPAYREAHLRVDASSPVDAVVEQILAWVGY